MSMVQNYTLRGKVHKDSRILFPRADLDNPYLGIVGSHDTRTGRKEKLPTSLSAAGKVHLTPEVNVACCFYLILGS